MTTLTPRLQIPIPGPGDPFKPVSVDLPAIGARLDAIVARQPGVAVASLPVGEVGQVGQVRAGRLLALADFTTLLGLAAPAGLWNLSDVSDASGNARNLTNKGAVPFGVGINGAAASAAVFAGSTAQALYIADTGAADPFRLKVGTWCGWFRSAKRATEQAIVSKFNPTGNLRSAYLAAANSNTAAFIFSFDGTAQNAVVGVTDICDDRWHHVAATYDGSFARLYVDGALEAAVAAVGTLFGSSAPLNIGAVAANGATAATSPNFGRLDAVFVTGDVLTEEQIRLLYAAKVAHGYEVAPTRAHLGVVRRRRGASLVVGDFPATPLRLHNFTAAALTDAGSNNVALAPVGGGTITDVAGADGTRQGAQAFSGAHTGLGATDAGLPAGAASRSYGCWFKTTTSGANQGVMGWGTTGGTDTRLAIVSGSIGMLTGAFQATGPFVADGQWHHGVIVEDNAAADGLKRKLYLDGALVASDTNLVGIVLVGANRFRVGANPDSTAPFLGQINGVFVAGVALTADQVWTLYQKSGQSLPVSPKNEGDHVEGIDATNVYAIFDSLEPQHLVDLRVAA